MNGEITGIPSVMSSTSPLSPKHLCIVSLGTRFAVHRKPRGRVVEMRMLDRWSCLGVRHREGHVG